MFDGYVDEKSVKDCIKGLRAIAEKKIPAAVKMTLNQTAYEVAQESKKVIRKNFINRNKWTQGGVRYQKVKGNQIDQMYSAAGHMQSYMETQETGGKVKAKSKRHAYPMKSARTSKSMKKLVRKSYRLRNMSKLKVNRKGRGPGGGKPKPFIMKMRSGLGIYQNYGAKRKRKGKRLKMLYDLSNKSVKIRARKWLHTAVARQATANAINRRFISNSKKIMREHA